MTEASAPGKLILCGEHAVVYGRPAIALPLHDLRARVVVEDGPPGGGITFVAGDLGRRWTLAGEPADPLSELAAALLEACAVAAPPDLLISINSTIPIAGGMGSGAAVATALVRALARHLGRDLAPDAVSALVYASERRFHGTPSGIDNTVIAYERAIWFVRQPPTTDHRPPTTDHRPPTTDHRPPTNQRPTNDQPTTNDQQRPSNVRTRYIVSPTMTDDDQRSTNDPRPATCDLRPATCDLRPATCDDQAIQNPKSKIQNLTIAAPLTLLIGDSGVRSATRLPVGDLRRRWQAEPGHYEALFDAIAALVAQAREALACGDIHALGALLDENHALLQQLGVSSPELDRLVGAARAAGALGAKLSGAGWGGIMLALVTPAAREPVAAALAAAGAARVIAATVEPDLAATRY